MHECLTTQVQYPCVWRTQVLFSSAVGFDTVPISCYTQNYAPDQPERSNDPGLDEPQSCR